MWLISCLIVFIFSLCIGSFLNVLIYRIPKKEQFIKGNSYCPNCKHKLEWYDNIPLFSYLRLKGKCRYCSQPISKQYPIVELLNAILCTIIFGYTIYSVDLLSKQYLIGILYCFMVSILITLSVIDFKTYEIPMGCNVCLFIIGILIMLLDTQKANHIIGMFCISVFLLIVYIITNGNGIGFGDVKLMFSCGLIVGWKNIIVGFLLGCIIAIICHTIRMKVTKETHMLAFGPYLSIGVYISLFIGTPIINSYLHLIGAI